MRRLIIFTLLVTLSDASFKRALQKSHEKPQPEKWMDKFHGKNFRPTRQYSIVNLLTMVTTTYLHQCVPVVLYERTIYDENRAMFNQLFKQFPMPFVQGEIVNQTVVDQRLLTVIPKYCRNYILIISDIMESWKLLHGQHDARVVIISRSTQWRVQEFLSKSVSHVYVNLLVVGETVASKFRTLQDTFILYTHQLFVDGLGSSLPQVLTSWKYDHLTRPHVDLFPRKLLHGLAGHRFLVAVANQPPYVVKRVMRDSDGGNEHIVWDGIEVRILKLVALLLNFTLEYKDVMNRTLGSGTSVTRWVEKNKADIGIAGLYVTADRLACVDVTSTHSQDCAAFISLMSTALPKYRAIMGPFNWTVWLALTITYLFGILPLSFSDKHSFRHLIDNPGAIENMFWYVFGTFTNCFTFSGKQSWSKSNKITTRLLIGMYWTFTIIITACYTGSIIAFVTIPVFPETVDTTNQVVDEGFRLATLDKDGWNYWFQNSSDKRVFKLFRNARYVPDVHTGLMNVTHSFFWSYVFLGSREYLDYTIRTNFTTQLGKRSLLHISKECFVPYSISMIFPLNSLYRPLMDNKIVKLVQYGFADKITNDVKWDLYRSSTGRLLQASASSASKKLTPQEDKALTLDDTQGMFLLLGIGFILAGASLFSEYVGGCMNYIKRKNFLRRNRGSITSDSEYRREFIVPENSSATSISPYIEKVVEVHATEGTSSETSTINSEDIDEMFNLDRLFGDDDENQLIDGDDNEEQPFQN